MGDARFEVLLRKMLPVARRMLCQGGDFHPFAATYCSARGVALLGHRQPTGSRAPTIVREMVESALHDLASEQLISACALCTKVEMTLSGEPQPKDAVLVSMETEGGGAVDVYMPYSLAWDGAYHWDTTHALPAIPMIFRSDRSLV